MTGSDEFDQCTRGFYFSLCSLLVGAIFCTLATVGIRFCDVFVAKWKSVRAKNDVSFACKNVLITVHSPAFGGRGIFVTSKKRAILCRPKCSSTSRISNSFGTPRATTHFAGRSPDLRDLLKAFGLLVLGVDTMLYGMNCQCSGENLTIKHFLACVLLIWGFDFLLNSPASAQFVVDSSKSFRNVLLDGYSWSFGGKVLKSNLNGNSARKSYKTIIHLSKSKIDYYSILRALILVIGAFACGYGAGIAFDLSCGYPGEGPVSDWSNKHPNLSMATWNTRSLTFERFYYCQSLGYDVLALTELWRNAPKFADGTVRWTHGESKKNRITGLPIYPNDKAAGVGILLSARAQKKYISHGSPGERICWVRLKGPTVNLFIVAVYMPHRARVQPAQHNTMIELTKLLKEAPSNDCIVLLGDFNEQLQANVKGYTGKWGSGEASKNAESVLDLMRMFNLCAANTFFKPKRNCSNATYLAPDNSDGITSADQEFVGRKTKVKYKGAVYSGVVQGLQLEDGKGKWTVRFADGYIRKYDRRNLGKILQPIDRKTAIEKQIDYVMVSHRWISCVKQSKPCWGPSFHRNKYGRADHALVNCIWKWRVRIRESKPGPNWLALRWEHPGGGGEDVPTSEPEPLLNDVFSNKLKEKLDLQTNSDHQDDAFSALDDVVAARLPIDSESRYDSLCKAICDTAKETLPVKKSLAMAERCVSARTSQLFTQREKMRKKKNSKEQFNLVQSQIKESSLQDFKDWVEKCTEEMEMASTVGDSKKIYQIVQHLSKKALPPPRNLTHDSDGKLLKSPEEIAAMWYEFLKSKFAETQKEKTRAPMPDLPRERSPSDSLTRREFEAALKRLGCAKATGPDGVPIEAFKFCQVAKDELFAFLQQVWEEEQLPQNFTQAKFVMLFKNKGSHKDPAKYRCIGLLNHSYKILSIIILMRLLHVSEGFLPDWQAGFRAGRGCRDNSFILRTLCDQVMAFGESIAITFIDYSAVFDTVSHRSLDEALAKVGAPVKVRAMFRAVYSSSSAFTTVPAPDGKKVKSDVFCIRRGVVQGDITSPLYFILALELILRRHDAVEGKGVSLADTVLHSLGYADDIALIDRGDPYMRTLGRYRHHIVFH